MDFCAVDDDTYDVDCDGDGFFSTSLVGYGRTEDAAIRDLLEQIEERDLENSQDMAVVPALPTEAELDAMLDLVDVQMREIDCTCDGEGCRTCGGRGAVLVETVPVTLADLEEMGAP